MLLARSNKFDWSTWMWQTEGLASHLPNCVFPFQTPSMGSEGYKGANPKDLGNIPSRCITKCCYCDWATTLWSILAISRTRCHFSSSGMTHGIIVQFEVYRKLFANSGLAGRECRVRWGNGRWRVEGGVSMQGVGDYLTQLLMTLIDLGVNLVAPD